MHVLLGRVLHDAALEWGAGGLALGLAGAAGGVIGGRNVALADGAEWGEQGE